MVKSVANSPSEASSVVTPGQLFKSKREEKGLEKKDIVKALRLSLYQIEALENDEYDKLPEATYVIGYWRSYAKLLKIDASQSIEYYRDHINAPSSTIALEAHHRRLYGQHEKHKKKIALFLSLFSVLLLLGIWYWQTLEDNIIDKWIGKESDRQSSAIEVNNDDKALSIGEEITAERALKSDQYVITIGPEINIPEHVEAGQSAVSENLEAPLNEASLNNEVDAVVENEIEADDVIVAPQQALEENQPEASQPEASQPEVSQPEASQPEASQPEASQPEVSQTSSQTSGQTIENSSEPEEEDYQESKIFLANPSNSIYLKVEKKTWLDVRDVAGKKLIYRTARAGEEIQLNGRPPFYIFVGVVGGVLVEYLGEAVEMDAPDDSDFQRIRVGRQE